MEERPKRIIEQKRQLGNMPNFFCVKRQHKIVPRSILPGTASEWRFYAAFRGTEGGFLFFVVFFDRLIAQNKTEKFVENTVF
ncbi:MAG: hypothetical protein HFF16_08620 [Angelakisella sp.]|nr:hypothetical protein [Angelakisella sp.]